jgi:hypothetical protein
MSWLFSQALVAEYSEANSSDGAPSAPSNTTPTPQAFLWRDKTTDAWNRFPSGMTCEPLMDDRGEALLKSYLAASHAPTSVPPARVPASPASSQDCGPKWRALSARFDRASSSWKTAHCLLSEDLPWSSVTLPKWGMMQDGELWERTTLALRTSGTGAGLWPTPNVPNGGRTLNHVKDWRGRTAYHNGKKVQVGLEAAVKMWPTPTASDYRSPNLNPAKRGQVEPASGHALPARVGGQLNPPWTEWLMGWPIAFTDCAVSATDKFQQWLRSHGVCLEGRNDF